jgi:hypothetical protein
MEQSADFDAQIVESLEMASTLRRFDRQWIAETKTESLLVRLLNTTYSSGLFGIGVNALGGIVVQGFQSPCSDWRLVGDAGADESGPTHKLLCSSWVT